MMMTVHTTPWVQHARYSKETRGIACRTRRLMRSAPGLPPTAAARCSSWHHETPPLKPTVKETSLRTQELPDVAGVLGVSPATPTSPGAETGKR